MIADGAGGEVAEVNAGVTSGVGVLKSACVGVERLDGLGGVGCLEHRHRELIVVAIGGAGTIKGGLLAAMILGISDVAGKYYVPQVGSFIIYFLMVVLMILFPVGLYGRRA